MQQKKQSSHLNMRKVWHHQIWISNYSGFIVLILMYIHSGPKCLARLIYLWSKMSMLQRVWINERVLLVLLALAFCNLILIILYFKFMISSQDFKKQVLKIGLLIFQPLYKVRLETSNNPLSLTPALWNIGFFLHEQATCAKYFGC